jgi:hypothetical protein
MVCHNSTTEGGITYQRVSHACSLDCIAALKAKLAERPTSETKPERFERLREFISHSAGYAGSYTWDYLIDEVKDILAAHDEVADITQLGTRWYARLLEWREKWA